MAFKFISELKEVFRYNGLPRSKRNFVFYSEGPAYWTFLGSMVVELLETHNQDVCYISSQADDPGLHYDHPKLHKFNVGFGACRTYLMNSLECSIATMNLTDLDSSFISRSSKTRYYINVRHALVSTHMVLQAKAFDAYDCIFVGGVHQKREIRAREQEYGLPRKHIFGLGYGRIDTMLSEQAPTIKEGGPLTTLIAPSWAGTSILETCGVEIIDHLLDAGQRAVIRPHPHMLRETPEIIDEYYKKYAGNENVIFDLETGSTDWLAKSDGMMTDWSGVAFEYAFVRRKPVIFIDTPKKILNPDYKKLDIVPLEISIREKMGVVIGLDELSRVPGEVERLTSNTEQFAKDMEELLHETVHNVGCSGSKGAEELMRLLQELQATK